MEERKKVKRIRVTTIGDANSMIRWESILRQQVPPDETFVSLKIESCEQKAWDDDNSGPYYKDMLVLRTAYYNDETDKEVVERMQKEARNLKAKQERARREEDDQYLTYLRLKTKYEGQVDSNSKGIDMNHL